MLDSGRCREPDGSPLCRRVRTGRGALPRGILSSSGRYRSLQCSRRERTSGNGNVIHGPLHQNWLLVTSVRGLVSWTIRFQTAAFSLPNLVTKVFFDDQRRMLTQTPDSDADRSPSVRSATEVMLPTGQTTLFATPAYCFDGRFCSCRS